MRVCKIKGCGDKHEAHGLCASHYAKKRRADPSPRCFAEGCEKKSICKGLCTTHYERFRKYGDYTVMKQRPHHTGSPTGKGYWHTQIDGKRKHDQVWIAERALGRPLPKGAVVHHADENPMNNDPTNLVICPSQAYHSLLHVRLRAMKACGNPTHRKCWLCKEYDDPNTMTEVRRHNGSYFYHRDCVRSKYAERKSA